MDHIGFIEDSPAPGCVLDLACGAGRHARVILERGFEVLAVDRDVGPVMDLAGHPHLEILALDLETGAPWPFAEERFRGVLVANYLHRPTLARTLGLVAPGGVLLYETFGVGNEGCGRPTNPAFLAEPGEIAACARRLGFSVVVDFHGMITSPRAAVVQRILGIRGSP